MNGKSEDDRWARFVLRGHVSQWKHLPLTDPFFLLSLVAQEFKMIRARSFGVNSPPPPMGPLSYEKKRAMATVSGSLSITDM